MCGEEIIVQLVKRIFDLGQELEPKIWKEVVGTYTKNVSPIWEVVVWMMNGGLTCGCSHKVKTDTT